MYAEGRSHFNTKKLKGNPRARETPWQVKGRATKPDDLSPIPGIHRVERENRLSQVVL